MPIICESSSSSISGRPGGGDVPSTSFKKSSVTCIYFDTERKMTELVTSQEAWVRASHSILGNREEHSG